MQKKIIDVGAVIESAKFTWVTAGIALMMIIIMLADGYDLFLMGHVGNHLVTDWGVISAAAVMTMLPVLIVFLIFQRWFVQASMAGALKQ